MAVRPGTYLLQLLILQITPHHHLEHNEQLPITDIPVAVDIIDFEREAQLLFLVAFGAESAEAGDELLEVDVAAAVFVENRDHSMRKGRVRSMGWR